MLQKKNQVCVGKRVVRKYSLKGREYVLSGVIAAMLAPAVCGLSLRCVTVFAAVWPLLIMAITDIRHMIIPDRWVLLLGAAALVSLIPGMEVCEAGIGQRIVGLFVISAPMALINMITGVCSGRGSDGLEEGICFGGGDIKLTAVCGFLLGWNRLVSAMMLAFMAAGLFAAALVIIKRKNRKQFFAFGPFICAGVIFSVLFSDFSL